MKDSNSTKHKAARLLALKLQPQNVYDGEFLVLQAVKGTPWDSGTATLEATTIADRFWAMYSERGLSSAMIG